MESLLQLRKRLSQWDGDDDAGTGRQQVKKIKIVSSDGTLKYNFIDESCPVPSPAVNRGKPIITRICTGDEYLADNKPVVTNHNPFVIRIETAKPTLPLVQQLDQHHFQQDAKVVYIKSDQQQLISQESSYPPLPPQLQDDGYPLRRCAPVRHQRRSQNPSFTDEEVRDAYAKLQISPPDCPFEEMNNTERDIYRFVRRRLMNKNSARLSRQRRKELFKEYENTIQIQTERIERSENKLRLLLACFINAVTLIALQSMPQLVRSSPSLMASPSDSSIGCPNCQHNDLFSSAMVNAIQSFEPDIYDDMEGIDQLIVDMRVCNADRPVKQLLQRQERSLSSIFNASGIKDVLSNVGIPHWKLSMLTSSALRSAWSIFLGPEDQALLFDETAKQESAGTSAAAYFETFVSELFDPVKHAELIDAINGGDYAEPRV